MLIRLTHLLQAAKEEMPAWTEESREVALELARNAEERIDIPVLLIGYDPSWVEGTFIPRPPAPTPPPPVRSIAQIKKWRRYGHLVAKAYDKEMQLWLCTNKDGVECYRTAEELHALRRSWL